MAESGMVIIGAGEAGAGAATALRAGGWIGPVTLIGEEMHPPYERPPLSKAVMLADGEPALPLIGHGARFADLSIVYLAGTRATAIDRAAKTVRLDDSRALPYAKLLLATGARPRRMAIEGNEAILYLRSFSDALAIRSQLGPGRRLVIIGGGFIGLELAASAREREASVTVVEAAPRILMRGVPARLADGLAERHRAAGVDLRTGVGITWIEPGDACHAVWLADGSRIEADCIVAGIGATPNTALAEAAGLTLDNGIAVDETLTTSDPDIMATGDCCSFPHPLYEGRRIRLEAWRNAQDQGSAAARTMLGAGNPFTAVPWFWSDQYDQHLQIAGLADGSAATIERDIGEGAVVLFHLAADGRLLAASGLGPIGRIAKEVRLAEKLIARSVRPAPDALASPAFKLKSLLVA